MSVNSSEIIIPSVVGLALLLGLSIWTVRACSIAEKATLEAAEENIERKNFENSQTYREGLRRDCDELMRAYAKAKSDDERIITLATLRHRVAGAPPEAVPADVQKFLSEHP